MKRLDPVHGEHAGSRVKRKGHVQNGSAMRVREMLLRNTASERYVQRKHTHVASTGFALAAACTCYESATTRRRAVAPRYTRRWPKATARVVRRV